MWKFLVLFFSLLIITASAAFDILRVEGESMEPQFSSGDIVLVRNNLLHIRKTCKDDIVVFKSPLSGRLNIKRCSAVDDGGIFVTGYNLPESTDSRHFGRIPAADIRGWVWIKI